jgi:hypothetical protein
MIFPPSSLPALPCSPAGPFLLGHDTRPRSKAGEQARPALIVVPPM